MTRDDVMRETLKHVRRVGDLLATCIGELTRRAIHHDDSKFSDEEFPAFAESTPALRGLTYGSDEYKAAVAKLGPALAHHYAENTHHPEHFRWRCAVCNGRFTESQAKAIESFVPDRPFCPKCIPAGGSVIWECELVNDIKAGLDGMDLLDVLEMLCDWKAAGERHADGSLAKSLEVNRERFGISPQLEKIMRNTAVSLGWIQES